MRRLLMAEMLAATCFVGTGCGQFDVRVTCYLSRDLPFPPPKTGHKVAVQSRTEPAEPLLEKEVKRKIEVLLRERGYQVANVEQSDYVLVAFFAIDNGATVTGVSKRYHPGGTSTSHVHTGSGQWATVTTQNPGHTSYVPHSVTEFTRFLGLSLFEKQRWIKSKEKEAGDAIVWSSSTRSSGSSSDLRDVVDYLLVATFDYFGEDTGKAKKETLFESSPSVGRLRKVAATAPVVD